MVLNFEHVVDVLSYYKNDAWRIQNKAINK